jgi:Fe-S cluster assembly ATP-binding protein
MLKITNLNAGAELVHILEDINLEVNAGEIHAILGPSHSGKTVLGNVIAGNPEYTVIEGRINFKRKALKLVEPEERTNLGMFLTFQNPPDIIGIKNIELIEKVINSNQKSDSATLSNDYRSLIKHFDLGGEWVNKDFNLNSTISERKKNEIAQMMVLDPSLVVFDAIEEGLDKDSFDLIVAQIKLFLEKKNKAAIFISQKTDLLNAISPTHVHVMVNGKIVKSGDKRIIKRIEKNGYREFS